MEVLFGKPPRMQRNARTRDRAPGPLRHRARIDLGEAIAAGAAAAGGGGQDLPRHHRRSLGHRPGGARPDGGPLAGAGGRRRRDRLGLRRLHRRGHGDGRAAGWSPCWTPPPRPGWRWPRPSPTSPRRRWRGSSDVKLSANWMAAAGHPGEDARLYQAVRAVGAELCPALGIAIPVGKDSMSMRTVWQDRTTRRPAQMLAPAVAGRQRLRPGHRRAPRADPRDRAAAAGGRRRRRRPSCGWSISVGAATAWAARPWPRCTARSATSRPIWTTRGCSRGFFAAIQELAAAGRLLAYHDRSDGGLFCTAVRDGPRRRRGAGHRRRRAGRPIRWPPCSPRSWARWSSCAPSDVAAARGRRWPRHGLERCFPPGRPASRRDAPVTVVQRRRRPCTGAQRSALRAIWSDTTFRMQSAARRSRTAPPRSRPRRLDAGRSRA